MSKAIYALYDDDDIMVSGAKVILAKNVKIKDVYSPFPIHGLENVLGIKWTRLAINAFLYGITALALALLGMSYFMIQDWPMNIGGKPSFALYQNLPAFIPVTFEFTVLCVVTFFAIIFLFLDPSIWLLKLFISFSMLFIFSSFTSFTSFTSILLFLHAIL